MVWIGGCGFSEFVISSLDFTVSIEKSAVIQMGLPVCVTWCFSLAYFHVPSLSCVFIVLSIIQCGLLPGLACLLPVPLYLGRHLCPTFGNVSYFSEKTSSRES